MKQLLLDLLTNLNIYKRIKINIALSLVLGAIFTACSSDMEVVYEITSDKGMPTFMVRDLETYYSDSGYVKVKIYAEELYRFERIDEKFDEYPEGIRVEFIDNYGNITSTLTCQYAKYYIDNELWEARSNVEVINFAEDESLNTELLYWDLQKEQIYSDKFVRIKTQNEILFGQGFESNQEFSKWRILRPTGTIIIEDEE